MPVVVYILGLTIFSLTTAEFSVAGVMPALSAAFNVSVGRVGYLISYYALGMALGGPVLTALLLTLRLPNKRALVWLLVLYVGGGVGAAMATQYQVMAFARIVMGIASSACIGVALTLCAESVMPASRGHAVSIVLSGLMLAPVLGVPATTLIATHFGWRASFWAVALLSLCCLFVVTAWVAEVGKPSATRLSSELRALCNRRLWAAYATSGLITGATFAAFSYVSAIFTQLSGYSGATVPILIALYGVANVVGNIVVGRYADRRTIATLAVGLSVLSAALAIFASFADSPIIGVAAFLIVGLSGVTMNPAMVSRVMQVATPSPLVNTMHASIITAGLAFGSWAGGVAIDAGLGLRAPLWIGAVLAVTGLASLSPYLLRRYQASRTALCE